MSFVDTTKESTFFIKFLCSSTSAFVCFDNIPASSSHNVQLSLPVLSSFVIFSSNN